MVVSQSIWQDAIELPETVSKEIRYVDLMQVIWEMGMKQAMYKLNSLGPDDERFTMSMKDLILAGAPPAVFSSLAAILTPFVDRLIHEVTTGMAGLGDVEIKRQEKGVARPVTVQKTKVRKALRQQAWDP